MSTLEVAALATALVVGAVVLFRRRRALRFEIAGTSGRAPVTAAVAITLTAATVGTAAAAVVLGDRHDRTVAAAGPSGKAVIVLDVSGSVAAGGSGDRVAAVVRSVADEIGAPTGLVVFADSAAEVLPPETPVWAVDGVARFFSGARAGSVDRGAALAQLPSTYASSNPWSDAFVGDTNISAGIDLARRLLVEAPAGARGGRIVLISDLEDGAPPSQMARALARAHRAGIAVTAVPLGGTPVDVSTWRSIGGAVDSSSLAVTPESASARPGSTSHGDDPLPLAACALAFAALLAGTYLWLSPLRLTVGDAP